MKKKIFTFVLFLYLFLELFSFVSLRFIEAKTNTYYYPQDTLSEKHRSSLEIWAKQESPYLRHDPELGWTIRENGKVGSYNANSAGFRSSKEVFLTKITPIRIACFGDSFTHGDEVQNSETWQSNIMQLNDTMEVLNFGVSGYAIDQSMLRYEKHGQKYNADIALIGFMSKDLYEVENRFRAFQLRNTGMPFGKPRFRTIASTTDSLELIPTPLPDLNDYTLLLENTKTELHRIGQEDFYFKRSYKSSSFEWLPSIRLVRVIRHLLDEKSLNFGNLKNELFDTNTTSFILSSHILEKFAETTNNNQTYPIILFLPNKRDIIRHREGKTSSYSPLKKYLESNGLDTLDAMCAFTDTNIEKVINGHYTAEGNRYIAKWLVTKLESISKSLPHSKE